ncbi:Nn.00g052010.m01.CDS01 [Neocucurbitaria sp. VM-36]
MSSDYHVGTATAIQFQKIDDPVRRPYPVGTDCAWWARDFSQRVTSTMPASTPYDRTTPPSTPRFGNNSQVQRFTYPPYPTRPRFDPRDACPAVWPRDPSPPREYGPQDDLYYAFTRDAYLSSNIASVREVINQRAWYTQRVPSNHQTEHAQPKTRGRKPERDIIRLTNPLAQENSKQGRNPLAQMAGRLSKEHTLTSGKPGPAAKATGWLRKKRRPSKIFNVNFSFSAASRRRSCDRTPEISPRTSVSSISVTPTPSIEEPFKRPRIDSSSAETALSVPFGKPTLVTSPKSHELRSLPMTPPPPPPPPPPRHSVFQVPITTPTTKTSPPRPTLITTEAPPHPGRLVTFTSPSCSSSEYKLRIGGTQAYHEYLSTSLRRKSFPSNDGAANRLVKREMQMLARLDRLDVEAREYCASIVSGAGGRGGASGADGASGSGGARKRACTLERRDRTRRKSASRSSVGSCSTPVSTTATTPSSTMSTISCSTGKLRRSTSDPCTDAFLAHVRKSVEARKEAASHRGGWTYPVFADEIEKGFLDDAPL